MKFFLDLYIIFSVTFYLRIRNRLEPPFFLVWRFFYRLRVLVCAIFTQLAIGGILLDLFQSLIQLGRLVPELYRTFLPVVIFFTLPFVNCLFLYGQRTFDIFIQVFIAFESLKIVFSRLILMNIYVWSPRIVLFWLNYVFSAKILDWNLRITLNGIFIYFF